MLFSHISECFHSSSTSFQNVLKKENHHPQLLHLFSLFLSTYVSFSLQKRCLIYEKFNIMVYLRVSPVTVIFCVYVERAYPDDGDQHN